MDEAETRKMFLSEGYSSAFGLTVQDLDIPTHQRRTNQRSIFGSVQFQMWRGIWIPDTSMP